VASIFTDSPDGRPISVRLKSAAGESDGSCVVENQCAFVVQGDFYR
jgi:hypothetical protein